MELTKNQIKITKGVAILFMLLIHLFCTKSYDGLYTPIIMIGNVPLIYYLDLCGLLIEELHVSLLVFGLIENLILILISEYLILIQTNLNE